MHTIFVIACISHFHQAGGTVGADCAAFPVPKDRLCAGDNFVAGGAYKYLIFVFIIYIFHVETPFKNRAKALHTAATRAAVLESST
jgi:hypothetical protein